ncbi:hypothetical protein YK48G_03560 [Lentilactobacillus fungorum]|uniref:Extracellular protein n=1 Tax=Lentilactobacillus fungorum TaxID=2201250 RepID=A0ABQ3VXM0_9LACO|nr:hypothetical protein [Lentilactobacillus fungorum]GHP12931.1 hypothetical protein YK48G_03560 [Lentilactobacillus fungorum]
MKKQTLFYTLSLVTATTCLYIQSRKKHHQQRFLDQIVQHAKRQRPLKHERYLGSWQLPPRRDCAPADFHFGLNYQDNHGQISSQQFWADSQTGQILGYQLIKL